MEENAKEMAESVPRTTDVTMASAVQLAPPQTSKRLFSLQRSVKDLDSDVVSSRFGCNKELFNFGSKHKIIPDITMERIDGLVDETILQKPLIR